MGLNRKWMEQMVEKNMKLKKVDKISSQNERVTSLASI